MAGNKTLLKVQHKQPFSDPWRKAEWPILRSRGIRCHNRPRLDRYRIPLRNGPIPHGGRQAGLCLTETVGKVWCKLPWPKSLQSIPPWSLFIHGYRFHFALWVWKRLEYSPDTGVFNGDSIPPTWKQVRELLNNQYRFTDKEIVKCCQSKGRKKYRE